MKKYIKLWMVTTFLVMLSTFSALAQMTVTYLSTTPISCSQVVSSVGISTSIYYNLTYSVTITYTNTVTGAIFSNTTNATPPYCGGGSGGGCSNTYFIVTFPAFTLPAGSYNITIAASNGPASGNTQGFTSVQYPPSTLYINLSSFISNSCNGIGTIDYVITGGNPNAPITVTGSNGEVRNTWTGTMPTNTSVFSITASQGTCTNTMSFTASQTSLFNITASRVQNCNGVSTLNYTVNGAVPGIPVSVTWGTNGNSTNLSGSGIVIPSNDPITITATQAIPNQGSCSDSKWLWPTPPLNTLAITATPFQPQCIGAGSFSYVVTGAEVGVPVLVDWIGGSSTALSGNITTATAPATIRVTQGVCEAVFTFPAQASLPTLTGTAVFQRNCGGGGTLSVGNGFTLFVNGSQVSNPHVTTTGTEPPAFTVKQGVCPVTITNTQIVEPPATLSASGVFTANCNNPSTGNLVVTGSGTYSIQVSNNGSNPQNLGTHTLPASFNGISATHVRISSGTCYSPWTAFNYNTISNPDYSIDFGSYFYCDPRPPNQGNPKEQDGTLFIKLKGSAANSSGESFEVWSANPNSAPVFLFVAVSANGTLTGRVPMSNPTGNDLDYRRQVFRAIVNKVGYRDCQTEDGTIDQKTQPMGVNIVYPPSCLPDGDVVTLEFTVTADYIKKYDEKVFIVEATFLQIPPAPTSQNPNPLPPTNVPYIGNVPMNEIQYIPATFIDDVAGVYRFSMTFNQKAPFRLTTLAVTHRSHDSKQPGGQYGSNCYKAPIGVGKTFMPKLPSPSITLSGNCGATYTTILNLDPLICQIHPKEWEIVGVSNGLTSIVGTFNANNATPTCNIPVSLSIPSSLEGLLLRHKLTQCTAPINIISGGNGNGGVSSNNGISITTLDGCSGNSAVSGYELSAPTGYNSYLWHPTNETTQTIFVTQAGTYSVSVVNTSTNCNSQLPSITVGPPPPIVLPLTANVLYTSCTTAQLSAVSGFDSYTWYDSSGGEVGQDMILTTNFADTYTLVAMKGECKKTLSIQVTFPQLQVFANPTATCAYVLQASTGFDSYLWSTGATTPNITVTSGTYTVTAIQGSCTQTASIHIDSVSGVVTLTINIPTLRMKNVLATSAATFSEQWLRTGSPLISSPSGFGNGGRGIWKPHETYAYITDRDRATGNNGAFKTPKVATDGIFNLNMFNWRYLGALNCSEWLKNQQITQYNPFNFEIENKDILDRYTAALYGYKNQLPIATVGNARVDEVAFESFEEYPNGQITSTDVSGTDNNLDLVTQSSNSMVNSYQLLLVDLGVPKSSMTEHIVYIKGTLFSTTTTLPIEVVIKGFRLDPNHPGVFIWKAKIVSYRVSSNVTELVLTSIDGEEPSSYWKGELGISKPERLAVSMNAIATLQDTHKHTGKKALKLIKNNGEEFFKMTPKRLHTIPGKKYVFSTWVKLANTCFLEGSMAKTELPKEEISKDTPTEETIATRNSYPVASPCVDRNPARKADYVDNVYFTFENPGDVTNTLDPVVYSDVIEGWVRIEHEFIAGSNFVEITCYNKNTKFDILFMDDIRIHPFNSSLQTYVYDTQNYKLRATLDGNNFSSLYFYDEQGNLYLTKKETERGIQTIQESSSHQPKKQ